MSSEIIPVSCDTEQTEEQNECDHRFVVLLPKPYGTLEIIEFDYCPKCGEKL